MALATVMHHSFKVHTEYAAPRGQTTGTSAREGEVREQHYGLRAQKRPLPGMRPALLVEVQPQGCVERHVVEDPSELAPLVPLLDDPVPQTVDTVLEFFRALDLPVVEQVIAVPKISTDRVSQRLVERRLPQMVEQLVDVPTLLSPTRIALQIAEQIVDTPVPRGRDERRVQGFLPRQSSTATPSAEERISERIVEESVFPSSAKRTSERIEEQLVDTSPGGGLAQGSASSAGPAEEVFSGFFALFPVGKKCACRRESECGAAPGGQLMDSGGLCGAQWFG